MDRRAEKAIAAAIAVTLATSGCGGVAPLTCYDVIGTYQPQDKSYSSYTHKKRQCTEEGEPQPTCNQFENGDISFRGGANLTNCKVKPITE